MTHWYCARLTLLRNTALGSGSFCNSAFFSPKYPQRQRSESNNIGYWLIQSKKDDKDQESIQSSTTPDPEYQWESNKLTVRHHRRELRSREIYKYITLVHPPQCFLRALSRGERMLRGESLQHSLMPANMISCSFTI